MECGMVNLKQEVLTNVIRRDHHEIVAPYPFASRTPLYYAVRIVPQEMIFKIIDVLNGEVSSLVGGISDVVDVYTILKGGI
jgi:hypothetical protein